MFSAFTCFRINKENRLSIARSRVVKMKTRTSEVWCHFDVISEANKVALCTICKQKLSFKSSVSNLKKHLKVKHFAIIRTECRQSVDSSRAPALNPNIPTTSSASSASTSTSIAPVSNDNLDGRPPGSITVVEQPSTQLMTAPAFQQNVQRVFIQSEVFQYVPKKITHAQKKETDDALLLLFILDFQPFSIVEDKGF